MMTEGPEVRQELDEPLEACRERQAGMSWPLPIHHRLDELVARANSRGAGVNRKTLTAALLLAATDDPDELLQIVLTYRTATARLALIDVPEGENVVSILRHKPGPRTSG